MKAISVWRSVNGENVMAINRWRRQLSAWRNGQSMAVAARWLSAYQYQCRNGEIMKANGIEENV